MKMIDMTCPKCGATMKTDADKEQAVCEYCGALFLLEKEDTLDEIRAKAEAKAYGYHKGKLAAEERAAKNKKKSFKIPVPAIVITILVLIGVVSYMSQEMAKPKVNPFINMSYGMYYGNLTQVQWSTYIMAYDSVEEIRTAILLDMESYMELKKMDL